MSFFSERLFSIYSYSMSHGLLLLRSGKTNEFKTRIEILFQDVRAMELRVWLAGIAFEEVDREFLEKFPSKPAQLMEIENKAYAVRSGFGRSEGCLWDPGEWTGFVLGGNFSTSEDDGNLFEPSALMPDCDAYPSGRSKAP
jgi:hypothetical protein